jgi:hypothetical protein
MDISVIAEIMIVIGAYGVIVGLVLIANARQ